MDVGTSEAFETLNNAEMFRISSVLVEKLSQVNNSLERIEIVKELLLMVRNI